MMALFMLWGICFKDFQETFGLTKQEKKSYEPK